MKNIEIRVLNPEVVTEAEKMMVCAARLTQRGHKVKTTDDFVTLYNKSFKEKTAKNMVELPHNTIRQFHMIQVVVVGASRRFLAQITRRRVGVTFTSASLQYSDYSDDANFVVPYEVMQKGEEAERRYLTACKNAMSEYVAAVNSGIDHDAAGYMAPQGLANVLLISATPQAWCEMIAQRICRRNSKETAYIMLKIWEALYTLNPILFSAQIAGPSCMRGNGDRCDENLMFCGDFINPSMTPTRILENDFPLLMKGGKTNAPK